VVQVYGSDEGDGYNDDAIAPDRAEAERGVAAIASLFGGSGSV